jgi:hypothetical protein
MIDNFDAFKWAVSHDAPTEIMKRRRVLYRRLSKAAEDFITKPLADN